jgi:dephospho-CoA kinase
MIIGISGTLGSGKDTVAQYLAKKGWQHISLSDLIRAEAKKRGIGWDRDSLRNFANLLKTEQGGDALAKIAVKQKKKANFVISSVRKPEEVEYLRSIPSFKLLYVDAPIKLRYKRIITRARVGDTKLSLQDLKKQEQTEMSGKSSQVLSYCKDHADLTIDNSKSLKYLYKQMDKVLNAENQIPK